MTGETGAPNWSDETIDQFQWHDVAVHGIASVPDRFELYLDVDYILEWICPAERPSLAQFRIAPATLIFEHASDVRVAVNSQQGLFTISAVRRTRREPLPGSTVTTWDWVLECEEGEVAFSASACRLVFRRPPVLTSLQVLSTEVRGLPFSTPSQTEHLPPG